jgi:hypothetical protein
MLPQKSPLTLLSFVGAASCRDKALKDIDAVSLHSRQDAAPTAFRAFLRHAL